MVQLFNGQKGLVSGLTHTHTYVPYYWKAWWEECLVNLFLSSFWRKKVWQMNRSTKGLLIVTTNLDGFSLVNRRRFTKFAKFSTHQTFPLYIQYAHMYIYTQTHTSVHTYVHLHYQQWW